MNKLKLIGLVAATHTPFRADGSLNLAAVEAQAAHLLRNNIRTVFIAGSTGESHSLALMERLELAQRWIEVARGTSLKLVMHVGSNCLGDAKELAAQAGGLGVLAISALAPSYFKPRTLGALIEWCATIAAAAPETPFYYYDIPIVTGVHFSMPDFLLQAADRIPTLAGIKFTNYDLMNYQLCLRVDDGAFDIPWGADEALLGALSLGAQGAIGTSYNFAAPLYHRMLHDFRTGKMEAARQEQFCAVQLIQLLAGYGLLAATKAVMNMLGVDVGPARLPHANPTAEQIAQLRGELEQLGFFDWIAATKPQPTLSP
jgi:N-acetylneuraminate lyase